jgi:hypothetical protein
MIAVIMVYDQLMFRPLVAWADKFRFEQTSAQSAQLLVPRSAPAQPPFSELLPTRRRMMLRALARQRFTIARVVSGSSPFGLDNGPSLVHRRRAAATRGVEDHRLCGGRGGWDDVGSFELGLSR